MESEKYRIWEFENPAIYSEYEAEYEGNKFTMNLVRTPYPIKETIVMEFGKKEIKGNSTIIKTKDGSLFSKGKFIAKKLN